MVSQLAFVNYKNHSSKFITGSGKINNMKILFIFCSIFLGWFSPVSPPDQFPQAEISNGAIKAVLFLPDSATGYYQGTRFDWSGVIKSLEYKEHSYFGQWFKKYDPKLHDAISGPVEEFGAIGYDDVKPGEKFIKIGVGALNKTDEKPYSSFTLYEIANPGKWKIKTAKDQVIFTQELKDETGYAYLYSKTLRLIKGKPELVLEHSLKNTGKRTIETSVYNHNFFLIDKELTGPNIKIKFPFELEGTGRGVGTFAEIKGKEINYTRELKDKEDMYIGALNGFQNDAKDYDFRIENHKSGAGVRIMADKPLDKLVFWACSTVSCPEPYIHIKANPGEDFQWKIHYEFYELGASGIGYRESMSNK